ncbi:MAG: DUF4386 family protein [Tetrasphaera sp.]
MTSIHTVAPQATIPETTSSWRTGGMAALAGAATNLTGPAVFIAMLLPKGLGGTEAAPGKAVGLLSDNHAAMRAWYIIIYLVFGACLVVLSLSLSERLKSRSSLVHAATTAGLIYAVLVIVIGTLQITDLDTVVRLHSHDPAQAATVYTTLTSIETGLGAGGGETMTFSLWVLVLSWAALRARELPRLLNYLGLLLGAVGIFSVLLNSLPLMSVNGVGLIAWLLWLGIAMLREGRRAALRSDRNGRPTPRYR